MLEMRHIGKSFAGVRVLDDVHFDLAPGEVHILAGENGAGKSTLIKILAGVYTDYRGEIRLGGQPVHFRAPPDAAAHGIAVIHQELSLITTMSVLDNLFLAREENRAGWVDRRRQRSKARDLFVQLGLAINPDRAVGEYPLATRQMIEIAKALMGDARIIIMDEPTSALNDAEAERLFDFIARLRERGRGVIYISHRMDEIYRLADRITVLRDGCWVGTAPAANLPREKLVHWMVGREITQQFPTRAAAVGAERLAVRGFCVPDPAAPRAWAVQGVDLTLRAGEIVGLAGLQGSGNSELMQGLFGVFGRRTAGGVALDGRPFRPSAPRQAIRQGVALLTNDRKGTGLVLDLSIDWNITLAALRRFSPWGWLRPRQEEQAAAAQRDALGIRCAGLRQPVGWLSGGNQQKVALAKWLETRPKVLLLDEPTRGLDVGAKHEIYELMNRWTREGMAILLITSEMPELLAMADRIIVLHRGRTTAEFPRAMATQDRILRAAMGERMSGFVAAQVGATAATEHGTGCAR